MLTFTLAISCLTTSNFPWFMDLTFQVPMQYCSLQHHTLHLSPVTSTAGYCFCFGSIPSFFLELFLYWSPVAYSPFNVLSFCLFILFMGFSRHFLANQYSSKPSPWGMLTSAVNCTLLLTSVDSSPCKETLWFGHVETASMHLLIVMFHFYISFASFGSECDHISGRWVKWFCNCGRHFGLTS